MRRVAVTVGVPTCTGPLPVLVLLLPVPCCGVWSVITMFSSRDSDVPCRIGRAAGAGGGVMNVRRRKKRKATISMSVPRTTLTRATRTWNSHVGMSKKPKAL